MRLLPLSLLLLAATPAWAVESLLPEARPADRYEKSLAQSPFALATVVEAPAAPQESFASNWMLTGLSSMPDENGAMQDFVTIRSRDQRVAFSLFGPEVATGDDIGGVSIVKVDRSPDVRKSTVTLKKGAEIAKVEFSAEVATPAPAPGPPQNGRPPAAPNMPGRPGGPPPNFNAQQGGGNRYQGRGGGGPALPRPPTVAPPNVRLPGAQPASTGGGPGAAPVQAQPDHRRVRVIQSKPY